MTDPFEQLKTKYLASFDTKYLDIKKALNENNHSVLLHLVHQLSGSAGSYGFDDISNTAWQIENTLHQDSFDENILFDQTAELLRLLNQAKAS